VPDQLIDRIRNAKDTSAQLNSNIQRALSEAQKTTHVFQTEMSSIVKTLNEMQKHLISQQTL
jgi:hypothetical protein